LEGENLFGNMIVEDYLKIRLGALADCHANNSLHLMLSTQVKGTIIAAKFRRGRTSSGCRPHEPACMLPQDLS
jgi:hypothetical protein